MRKLGDITGDMENILHEMAIDHEMQIHEILGIVYMYLVLHCPTSVEEFADGTSPVLRYS